MQQAVRIDRAHLEPAFDAVREGVLAGRLPAAVLAVSVGDETVRYDAVSRPRGDRVTPESIFFLASVTKPIVATAVMQLVEDGLLDIWEPVTRYIPEFTVPAEPPVTTWHLLTHTAGIPDSPPEVIFGQRPSSAAMLRTVCTTPLRFSPGSRYEYCSNSFYLLAELITRLSRMPYPEYMRRRIFQPLGMLDTTFDPRHARSRLMPVHGVGVDNFVKKEFALRYLASVALPGGGLWGTAGDLLRFGRAMLRGGEGSGNRVLSDSSVELMTREHTDGLLDIVDGAPRPAHYALGWGKTSLEGGVPGSPRAFEHGGASGTRLWIDPEYDLVFVFLTNQWGVGGEVAGAALECVYAALER